MNSNQNPNQFSSEVEVGEIKTALGRLYKEFESFKQTYKADKEKDRAELQAWAQTSLIQNQLLSKAMATIELLTKELKSQGSSWQEFETSNENLKLELIRSLQQSMSTPSSLPSSEQIELKGLKSELHFLKNTFNQLENQIKSHFGEMISNLHEIIQIQNQRIDRYDAGAYIGKKCRVIIVLGSVLVFSLLVYFIPVHLSGNLTDSLETIEARSDFIMTKLQRIERHLGTDPQHQK